MKLIGMFKSGFHWELSQEEVESGNDTKKWIEFIEAQQKLAKEFQLEFMVADFIQIDVDAEKLKRCSYCDQWAVDCEINLNEDVDLKPIRNGATVSNLFYCERCLPEGHKWAI